MADAQNKNPQRAHGRRNDEAFNVSRNRKRYRTVILCVVGMRYRVRRYKWFRDKGKATSSLVVSTTALSLVARSGMHNSLVDLPFRAGLVAGFGLEVKKKSQSHGSSKGAKQKDIHTGIPQGLLGSTLPLDFPRPPP